MTVVVGESLIFEVFANDEDGDPVEIKFDFETEIETTTIARARLAQAGGQATLQWSPAVGDVTSDQERIRLLFYAIDGRGGRGERALDLRVSPGNGEPRFLSPVSQIWHNCCGVPLEFEVQVADSDSRRVELTMIESPPGAEFIQSDDMVGHFRWRTDGSRPSESSYRAVFRADDGQNAPVTERIAIVVPPERDPNQGIGDPDGGGDAWECEARGLLDHMPLGPQKTGAATIPLTVNLTAEAARHLRRDSSSFLGISIRAPRAGARDVLGAAIEVPRGGGVVELKNYAVDVGRSVTNVVSDLFARHRREWTTGIPLRARGVEPLLSI